MPRLRVIGFVVRVRIWPIQSLQIEWSPQSGVIEGCDQVKSLHEGYDWRVWLSVSGSPNWAAVRISLLPSVASGDSISRLPDKTKPNPMPFIGYEARDDGQQKSQTPVITAFGFECLGLSGPKVAAEGLEPPTRGL